MKKRTETKAENRALAYINSKKEREFIIENILPEHEEGDNKVAVMCGEPSVGKTLMALQMGLHIVYNVPFLFDSKFKVNNKQKRKVLFLALEGGMRTTDNIKKQQVAEFYDRGYRGVEFDNLIIRGDELIQAEDYDPRSCTFRLLEQCIKKEKPCVVIIDNINNIAATMGVSLTAQKRVNEVLEPFRILADKYNFTTLFITHPTKSARKGVYVASGNFSLSASAHTIMSLWRVQTKGKKKKVDFEITKTNLIKNEEPTTRVVRNDNLICEVEE